MRPKCDIKAKLMEKGVRFPCPESVEIGNEVDPDRISGEGVVIHGGTKIFGTNTLILKGCVVGYEAPAVVENCLLGTRVRLNGGFFKDSVFLSDVSIGSGAHVREGCIFEEHSSAAHCVGVKQTILFPFVTLGSQINFCDCFMAGGTGKKNHSEVGSSYIHFNFTPQQDKATPSMMGDVPRGVMLNQSPIFLGGQGGMVGPCRLTYGVTVAAGTIVRQDELRENRLIFGGAAKSGNIAYSPGAYSNVRRIFEHNVNYIANFLALSQWYRYVRLRFVDGTVQGEFPEALRKGLTEALDGALSERIKRLKDFISKASRNVFGLPKQIPYVDLLTRRWPDIEDSLAAFRRDVGDPELRDEFIGVFQNIPAPSEYVPTVQSLPEKDRQAGGKWLQGIVDQVARDILDMVA